MSERDTVVYRDRPHRNGTGVAALVVGVVALVLSALIIFSPIGFVLGILAVILGAIGMRRASRGEADNRGQALSGLITGLLAMLIVVALGIGFFTFFVNYEQDFRKLGSCLSGEAKDRERAQCFKEFGNRIDED